MKNEDKNANEESLGAGGAEGKVSWLRAWGKAALKASRQLLALALV